MDTTTATPTDRFALDELTMLRGALIAMRDEAVERAARGTEWAPAAGTDRVYETLVSDAAARAGELIVDIDDALARMNDNTYGVCQSCGNEIALERLEAIPQTRTCVRCTNRRHTLLG